MVRVNFDQRAALRKTVADYSNRLEAYEEATSSDLAYAVAMDALVEDHERLQRLVESIAMGVPTADEWRSAADFMDSVARLLGDSNIERPDHYPEGW